MTAVPELRNDGIILNAHNDSEVAVHVAGYAASIGVTRLEAHAVPDNHASRHVAEAAGFTQADTFTDDNGTEFIRYTRDASGDRAAPFMTLGPDPIFQASPTQDRGQGSVLGQGR